MAALSSKIWSSRSISCLGAKECPNLKDSTKTHAFAYYRLTLFEYDFVLTKNNKLQINNVRWMLSWKEEREEKTRRKCIRKTYKYYKTQRKRENWTKGVSAMHVCVCVCQILNYEAREMLAHFRCGCEGVCVWWTWTMGRRGEGQEVIRVVRLLSIENIQEGERERGRQANVLSISGWVGVSMYNCVCGCDRLPVPVTGSSV